MQFGFGTSVKTWVKNLGWKTWGKTLSLRDFFERTEPKSQLDGDCLKNVIFMIVSPI